MIHISREEILRLAKAAHISFTEEEIPALVSRLESFISYASYLKEIAAEHDGAPMPKLSNVTRPDEAKPVPVEPLLDLAPARDENYYVVPVILKQ